jgi:hypothetical protein
VQPALSQAWIGEALGAAEQAMRAVPSSLSSSRVLKSITSPVAVPQGH